LPGQNYIFYSKINALGQIATAEWSVCFADSHEMRAVPHARMGVPRAAAALTPTRSEAGS